MPINVSENNPRVLDDQFAEMYPALGLTTTSNSGAFWGDGDLRPDAVDYSRIMFAVESKARFRGKQVKKLTPTPAEWDKAMEQLQRFHKNAIRMFLVWSRKLDTFAVSIPIDDSNQMAKYSEEIAEAIELGYKRTLARNRIHFRIFDEFDFDKLYKAIESYQLTQ